MNDDPDDDNKNKVANDINGEDELNKNNDDHHTYKNTEETNDNYESSTSSDQDPMKIPIKINTQVKIPAMTEK